MRRYIYLIFLIGCSSTEHQLNIHNCSQISGNYNSYEIITFSQCPGIEKDQLFVSEIENSNFGVPKGCQITYSNKTRCDYSSQYICNSNGIEQKFNQLLECQDSKCKSIIGDLSMISENCNFSKRITLKIKND